MAASVVILGISFVMRYISYKKFLKGDFKLLFFDMMLINMFIFLVFVFHAVQEIFEIYAGIEGLETTGIKVFLTLFHFSGIAAAIFMFKSSVKLKNLAKIYGFDGTKVVGQK